MAEEKKKKSEFKIERVWSIEVNKSVRVEPSAVEYDSLLFTEGGEGDGELFTISFEEFEALYFAVKAERERLAAFAELEKPKKNT